MGDPSTAASDDEFDDDLALESEAFDVEDGTRRAGRRAARRRAAGPVRAKIAANDDVPSIGGLIYALEQKPSNAVFRYAAIASAIWGALGLSFTAVSLVTDPSGASLAQLLTRPTTFLMFAAIAVPIAVVWFLALLAWRAEELRLRSSTMTEVAVRLAEPDRMAEDSVASLGQAVRRQVGFMNEAVGRALGRAGELEALVHNEVAALERSYEENERRIRGLINELAGEREALTATSSSFNDTLRTLGNDVPLLIEKLSNQQVNLAHTIEKAAANLTSLETTLSRSVHSLEAELGSRTGQLHGVLETYTGALGGALGARTEQLRGLLESHASDVGGTLGARTQELRGLLQAHTGELGSALGTHTEEVKGLLDRQGNALSTALGSKTDQMQRMLEAYTGALAQALGSRTEQMHSAFATHMKALDTAIANRTNNLQTVFEEYALALDSTLANRSDRLDQQIVERTRALDDAFKTRLQLFDETIERSTAAIDRAVDERARSLSVALENHAATFSETIARQSIELDEQLNQGISAVRRTSENITRQSLKAIDTLAGQSDMLRNVSENLLSQIHAVTNRFEAQGQTILKAANALESANSKIDQTLQARHADLSTTLERLDGKANEFGRYIADYSSTIEGSISEAEARARAAAEQLRLGTDSHREQALSEIERLRREADRESERALEELKSRLSSVSAEVSTQLGSLTSRFDETSEEVRVRTQRVAEELAREQQRMTAELDRLPRTSQETADAMRRALQDQLRALDQLSSLTTREAQRRDIALPVAPGGRLEPTPEPAAPTPPRAPPPAAPQTGGAPRSLTSLTASLSEELSRARPAGGAASVAAPAAPRTSAPVQPAAADPRDAWSLGDLLKRASREDDQGQSASGAARKPAPAPQAPRAAAASAPFSLNIDVLSRALDSASAAAIWSRLRAGQQGIMVRSIYAPEGRAAFDEVARRYPVDGNLQATINRYLADFERILRDAEAKDPGGRLAQAHMTSAMGRVYLVLAHASGRIT